MASKNFDASISKARDYLSKFDGGSVTFESCDKTGIGRIFLHNEGKKNSLTGKMMVDFYECVEQLAKWKHGKLVIISGKGEDFCSGGDLGFVKQIAKPEDGYLMCTFMGEVMRKLRSLPVISIANVKGYALGGGTEIVCSCDIRVSHQDAKLGLVQARLGVTPGWSGLSRLVEIVGRSKAIELLTTSAILSAKEAKELGIVNFVYESDDELKKYLEKFQKNEPEVIQACKKAISALDDESSFEGKHRAEREVFASVWGGTHHLEALAKNTKHNK
uniref:Ethylmalonyl-CoA decarboxylase n=1 Tax=Acrobeloides nanus TaxID=290746 RepID=A0A914C8V0_9BILA